MCFLYQFLDLVLSYRTSNVLIEESSTLSVLICFSTERSCIA